VRENSTEKNSGRARFSIFLFILFLLLAISHFIFHFSVVIELYMHTKSTHTNVSASREGGEAKNSYLHTRLLASDNNK
jgi:hypothetical protein